MFIRAADAAEAAKGGEAASAPAATTALTGADPQPPYELSGQKMLSDTVMFLILLFAIFYFMLIRPQQKRIKQHQNMLGSIKKGSRIVTGGGIYGTVVKTEGDDVLVVEIAQNVRIRIAKNSVGEVLTGDAPATTANDN